MATHTRSARVTRTDWGLLFVVLAMLVVGLVMVYSASYGFALMAGGHYEGQPTYFFRRQVVFALVGLVGLVVCWRVDYRLYRRYAVHILGLTVLALFAMAVLGRWVFRFEKSSSVQPVEVAKLGAMVYIAVWLAAKGEQIRNVNLGLVPFALLLGMMAGLIVAQPDFSTAVLLVATATAMFFVAGADMRQLLIEFLFGGAALVIVASIFAPYIVERVRGWIDSPFADPLGQGFQPVQSLKALNRGSWLGVGLGQSQQKFVIYAAHTDCMFAIVGEELGLIGGAVVILLYGLWAWRGLSIARHADDVYGMLLAAGIVSWVTFQAALHIAVVSATTPFTGTVLPFVSYGGSSLVSCMASVGILLNISSGGGDAGRRRAS